MSKTDRSLDDIVGVAITQHVVHASGGDDLLNQNFFGRSLRNSNTLQLSQYRPPHSGLSVVGLTFSMTFELNFCFASSHTMPQNFSMTGSERVGSPRSTETIRLDWPAPACKAKGLTDVLDDVVAEGILNKLEGMGSDSLNELYLLKSGGVVNAPLENAAPVTVSSNRDAVLSNGVENELKKMISQKNNRVHQQRSLT